MLIAWCDLQYLTFYLELKSIQHGLYLVHTRYRMNWEIHSVNRYPIIFSLLHVISLELFVGCATIARKLYRILQSGIEPSPMQ